MHVFMVIVVTWRDNYGDSRALAKDAFVNALAEMHANPRIPLLGMTQSLFEASMYTFVFLWPMSFAVRLLDQR